MKKLFLLLFLPALLHAQVSISGNDLENSGATAGTYKSVTVTAKGLVTGGTNPTTVAGYGLTDVFTKTDYGVGLTNKSNGSAYLFDGSTLGACIYTANPFGTVTSMSSASVSLLWRGRLSNTAGKNHNLGKLHDIAGAGATSSATSCLRITQFAGSLLVSLGTATDYIQGAVTLSSLGIVDDQVFSLVVQVSGGALTVYVNGVSVSPTVSSVGTSPTWSGSFLCSYFTFGALHVSGSTDQKVYEAYPLLGTLSSSEALTWAQTGALPTWAEGKGTAGQIVNGDMSSSTGWTLASGWAITGGQLVHSGSSAFATASQAIVLVPGTRYRYSYNVVSVSGGTLLFQQGTNTAIAGDMLTGVHTGTFIATEYSNIQFKNSLNGAFSAVVTAFTLVAEGRAYKQAPGRTAQARDAMGTRHGTITPGVLPLTSAAHGETIEFDIAATGFLGGDQPLVLCDHVIDSIEIEPTTSTIPTVTIRRTSSGGTTLVAAVAAGAQNVYLPTTLIAAAREGLNGDRYHVTLSTPANVRVRIKLSPR